MRLSIDTSFRAIFLLLATIVSCYALGHYWIYLDTTDNFAAKYRSLNLLLVYSHFIGAGMALLLGALQLFIKKGSRLHRRLGLGYCLAVLAGAIGAGYLSFFADGVPWTGLGFFTLDVIWLYVTFRALREAQARNIQSHRRWMIRSLALTAAAISLRLQLPLLMPLWGFEASYLIVAWSSWLGNLAIAESYLYVTTRTKTHLTGNLSS